MNLHVNGEVFSFKNNITISQLLKHFEIQTEKVAIEKNMEIILQSDYDQELKDNDKIEIVYFIGGG